MNRDEIYSIWAPAASPWSRWVKPVLFAWLDLHLPEAPPSEVPTDVGWSPPPSEKQVLVLDLPGAEGVWAGLALAARGYRPVPLYNALPVPYGAPQNDPRTGKLVAVVDVLPIMQALQAGTERLAQWDLSADAPPAFLLDARRQAKGLKPDPAQFDNRSISFTTDFPSANFLASHGFRGALLVQRDRLEPQADLAHTLRRWQEGGLSLARRQLDVPGPAEPFEVARPTWYGAMFQRALAGLGFRRSGAGGFGAWVSSSAAGG